MAGQVMAGQVMAGMEAGRHGLGEAERRSGGVAGAAEELGS
jgi:hypothetical protein